MPTGVRSVHIEGFASIRDAQVDLRDLNILVGANGSGKSNFIRTLELLGRIADGTLSTFFAVNGFSSVVHSGAEGIRLAVDRDELGYQVQLNAASEDRTYFGHERIWAGGQASTSERGQRESILDYPDPGVPAIAAVREMLSGCRVFHFHDTSVNAPPKRRISTADDLALRSDAGNLAAYLLRLSAERGPAYERIRSAIRLVAPFFDDFVLEPNEAGTLLLRWRQVDSDVVFSANQFSDGTLRFICLAALLLSPDLPRIVVLDEPELGLHPRAIGQLAAMLRSASVQSQIVIATQSVTLMNQFDMSDLIVVERRDGASVFRRPELVALEEWLEDYSLGDLWEKNLLGGGPEPERSA